MPGMSMQELFAEAAERLKAGEPLTAVVASYPTDVQAELGDLLAIVEMTEGVAVQPLPQRSPRQRTLARAQFLQQAEALRAEREAALGAPVGSATTGAGARQATAVAGWRERLAAALGGLLGQPLLRLAPLAAVVLAVYLATFWTVRTAEAALPGDAVYPIKQWVREQRVNLAPADQRARVISDVQEQIAQDAKALAVEMAGVLHTQPEARAELAQEYSEEMVYYGRRGNLLLIGPFLVAPNYQPDAGDETTFVAMAIDGVLEPGGTVRLTYRVLPGNPNIVQGVRAEVVDEPKPAPEPTATPQAAGQCQRTVPPNWAPYPVEPGDTLEGLARRSQASVATIVRVNCLGSEGLRGVSTLLLPDTVYVRVTPPAMPTPTMTPLPTVTPVPTVTATPEATATPQPPTVAPTEEPGSATPESPGEGEGTPPAPPEGTATPQPAETPAVTPAETPAATPDNTPAETPNATPAETSEPQPTAVVTETLELPATETSTAEPPTVPPTVPPTAVVTEVAVTVEPLPTNMPTPVATATREPAPTEAPPVAPTATDVPTREPTLEPAREATAAPTREPTEAPTRVVPTATPPPTAAARPEPPPTEAPLPPPPTEAPAVQEDAAPALPPDDIPGEAPGGEAGAVP